MAYPRPSSKHLGVGTSTSISTTTNSLPLTILVKRETEYKNTWHALMEILATFITLDVLRLAHDPTTNAPYFQASDFPNTQVLLLDELPLGQYAELWHVVAQKKPILRLSDITTATEPPLSDMTTHLPFSDITTNPPLSSDMTATFPLSLSLSGTIVIPIVGGANSFWQGDWAVLNCTNSALLKAFSRRVLEHYHIQQNHTKLPLDSPLVITFINRTTKRRLLNQPALLASLRPTIHLNVVDFADLPFADQLSLARSTDLLVGVHGAGLTHAIFLPPGSVVVVVGILLMGLKHKGFRNVASMLGHAYFTVEGEEAEPHHLGGVEGNGERGADWQADDVFLPPDVFPALVERAIRHKMGNKTK